MMNAYDKPPLGTAPYYVRVSERIRELAQAIERNADSNATVRLRLWAQEISEQCDLLDSLRSMEQ